MSLCALVASVMLVSLTGCGLPQPPRVSVGDARWTGATEEGTVLTFTLNLENPGDQPYELREVRYDLLVDGRRVYSGRRAPLSTLPAGRGQQIELPTVILNDRLPGADVGGAMAFNYDISGSVLYVAPDHIAEILLDTGVRRPRVRFSDQGTIE